MNGKKAKVIRRALNESLKQYGLTTKSRVIETTTVPSRRYGITIKEEGKDPIEMKNTATQARLQAGSPRQVYQQVKRHVQGSRDA